MFKSLLLFAFYVAFAQFANTCPGATGGFILKRGERLKCRPFISQHNLNAEECLQSCEADPNCGSIEVRKDGMQANGPKFVCRKFRYCDAGTELKKPDPRYCSYLKPRNCVGAFGGYGQCSATCGGGVKERTFSVTTTAMFEGHCSHADGETETKACGKEACPKPAYKCEDSSHDCATLASYGWCTNRMFPHVKSMCPVTCGTCGDLPTEESKVAHIKSENNKLKQANEALRKALETLSN